MSGEEEFYVGMRVVAMGREGTIAKVQSHGYDVTFSDGQVSHVPKANVQSYDSAMKQTGGPPPPMYTPSMGAHQTTNPVQYQYPTSQPVVQIQVPQQYVQQVPVQQSQMVFSGQPQHMVGTVSSMPVVQGVASVPVTVAGTPAQSAVARKVAGYENSPDIGMPLSDLCDCDNTLAMACCCPCILGGQVGENLGIGSYAMVAGGYVGLVIFCLIIAIVTNSGLIYLLLWAGWATFVLIARMKVREIFQIKGDGCEDCCITFCCLSCSLAQVARHLFAPRPTDPCQWEADGRPLWQRGQGQASTMPPTQVVQQQHPQVVQQQHPQVMQQQPQGHYQPQYGSAV